MAEVADLPGCEGTFVGTKFEFCVSETLEDLAEAVEVLLPGSGEDDDVVQVKEACFPVETSEDSVHESGEGGGALQRPKGTWLNSNNWPLLVRKAVFSLSRSWIGICQYPLLKSRVENQRAPCSASRRSSMRGMGCTSFIIAALTCLKSTQNRKLPSFFFTMTAGKAQRLLEGQMTLLDSICWTWAISSHRTTVSWRRYG